MHYDLPPVVLHRLGDAYFVEDGNHRVSVARFQGVGWIDAEVTYSRVRASDRPGTGDGLPARGGLSGRSRVKGQDLVPGNGARLQDVSVSRHGP